MSSSDRRRLVRFCLLRQQICPLCGNYIYFNNKDKVFKCKNEACDYIVESVDDSSQVKKENIDIKNEKQVLDIDSKLHIT